MHPICMGTQLEDDPARTSSKRRSFSVEAFAAGLLIGCLLLSAYAHVAHPGFWARFAGLIIGRSNTVDVSSPSVVEKIRQLSRLETVDYSLDKIVGGERESAYLPDFLVGDKLLLVAHGEVIAGVDLNQLKAGDVSLNNGAVDVRLPRAQILSTRIDNGRTRIYSRTTGLLVAADPNLESEVRLAAEQQITQAALADGILDKARANARTSVSALLSGLGYRTVHVHE
jgi:hypothetical protein